MADDGTFTVIWNDDGKPAGWYTDPLPPRSPTCGIPGHPEAGHGGHPEPEYTYTQQLLDRQERLLADKDAEIARLTAELDQTREVPVEYVTTTGLQAAMTADPDREDGTVLRVTDGDRQAWQWRARTGEWERIR